MALRVCRDLDEGERLWKGLWPERHLFDCWPIRKSFHLNFGRDPYFIVAESKGRPAGLLPLSWIEEDGYYGFFPGETWHGKTWLEQNRIPAQSSMIRQALWEAAPENTWLRYLDEASADLPDSTVDEVGYLFGPAELNYSFEAYWERFPGKSRKKIRREVTQYEAMECRYHLDEWNDIQWMFETNLDNFNHRSYFHDPRFLRSFESMLSFLARLGMLRVVSVRIKGRLAAVDAGAVYRNRYTVLAGATDPQFPGIAKVINLFHLKWACLYRIEQIDFLCGDFGWKSRFRLQPRPLYGLSKMISDDLAVVQSGERSAFAQG